MEFNTRNIDKPKLTQRKSRRLNVKRPTTETPHIKDQDKERTIVGIVVSQDTTNPPEQLCSKQNSFCEKDSHSINDTTDQNEHHTNAEQPGNLSAEKITMPNILPVRMEGLCSISDLDIYDNRGTDNTSTHSSTPTESYDPLNLTKNKPEVPPKPAQVVLSPYVVERDIQRLVEIAMVTNRIRRLGKQRRRQALQDAEIDWDNLPANLEKQKCNNNDNEHQRQQTVTWLNPETTGNSAVACQTQSQTVRIEESSTQTASRLSFLSQVSRSSQYIDDYVDENISSDGISENININDEKEECVGSNTSPVTHGHSKIGRYLYDLYQHDQLTDTIVIVGKYSFNTHGAVLACHSDYFREAMRGQTLSLSLSKCRDAEKMKYELNSRVSPGSFQVALQFMYTGELDINPDNVYEVMSCAAILVVSDLLDYCGSFVSNLPAVDLLSVVQSALGSNSQESEKLNQFTTDQLGVLAKNFEQISRTRKFLNIAVNMLCALISRDDLCICSEADVATAAFMWLGHSQERIIHADRVLKYVRITLMSIAEIIFLAGSFDTLFQTESIRQRLFEVLWFQTCRDNNVTCSFNMPTFAPRLCLQGGNTCTRTTEHSQGKCHPYEQLSTIFEEDKSKENDTSLLKTNDTETDLEKAEPRPHVLAPTCKLSLPMSKTKCEIPKTNTSSGIYMFGGFNPENDTYRYPAPGVERYDLEGNCWEFLTSLPRPLIKHSVVTVDGTIYVIGGCVTRANEAQIPSASVFEFNSSSVSWTSRQPLTAPRMYHVSVVLNGFIYVIGGQGRREQILSSAEYYDRAQNTWVSMSFPKFGRMAASAVAHQSCIYLAGGYGFDLRSETAKACKILASVECYNATTDCWTEYATLTNPRSNFALVVLEGKLVVCGGLTALQYSEASVFYKQIDTVEMLEETQHEWRKIARLPFRKGSCDMGVVVYGEKLYVAGGLEFRENTASKTFYCFDVSSGTWTDLMPLPMHTAGPQCVLLDGSTRSNPHDNLSAEVLTQTV